MKNLIYKGIIFDEYTKDPDGGVWAEICESCAEKYKDKIANNIDDGGVACGCCSVKGCANDGKAQDKKHYYIDFPPQQIHYTADAAADNIDAIRAQFKEYGDDVITNCAAADDMQSRGFRACPLNIRGDDTARKICPIKNGNGSHCRAKFSTCWRQYFKNMPPSCGGGGQ